jgi:dTDP-4-amino-4,6-dideoxygalactose transaminase
MQVPFVDLKSQYLNYKTEFDTAAMQVLSETAFISGRYAAAFEEEFAAYLGVKHCVACANGTDALEIALAAMGVGAGDEVLVPANTWISTAEAVTNVGAVPVFVDCDDATYNIDPNKIEQKITKQTKAVVPVHLYGLPADMIAVRTIADKYGLMILEDSAQAHGAAIEGTKIGSFGDAATFSFYPSKNLGAFGDAGGIVTNNDGIAARARLIANHGQAAKNTHTREGRNSRMDGVQAAVLSVKLRYLDEWTTARRHNAGHYIGRLGSTNLVVPVEPDNYKHVYHLFVVRVQERARVQAYLSGHGIETAIHYPTPLPLMEAYRRFGHSKDDFPSAARHMDNLLSLPMYAELTEEMIDFVCARLREATEINAAAGYAE